MRNGVKTVEEIVNIILSNAPPAGSEAAAPFPIWRLPYKQVEEAVRRLHENGMLLDLEAFDIRGTKNLWTSNGDRNYALARKATKKLLQALKESQPGKDLEEILPEISFNLFCTTRINRYKTTLHGILTYVYDSLYSALMDLINHDEEYSGYRDFKPFDMHSAPKHTWLNNDETKNQPLARVATKQLVRRLQEINPGKPLESILPEITSETFIGTQVNRYKTKLGKMLSQAYDGSPYEALIDLFNHDEEYAQFRDFQPFDMRFAPQNTWIKQDGSRNFELARKASKQFIRKLQEQNPEKKLEEILPLITEITIRTTQINRYGTTLESMSRVVYNNTSHNLLMDLINHDEEYAQFRDFQPFDMHHSPHHTWIKQDGSRNFEFARKATKMLVQRLREQNPGKSVEEILPGITENTFGRFPINKYGTTLCGMIRFVYSNSSYAALKDWAATDAEYVHLLPIIEKKRLVRSVSPQT